MALVAPCSVKSAAANTFVGLTHAGPVPHGGNDGAGLCHDCRDHPVQVGRLISPLQLGQPTHEPLRYGPMACVPCSNVQCPACCALLIANCKLFPLDTSLQQRLPQRPRPVQEDCAVLQAVLRAAVQPGVCVRECMHACACLCVLCTCMCMCMLKSQAIKLTLPILPFLPHAATATTQR